MPAIFALFWRLVVILIALLFAAFTAAAFAVLPDYLSGAAAGLGNDPLFNIWVIIATIVNLILFGAASGIAAWAGIAISEIVPFRSVLYYLVTGAICGLALTFDNTLADTTDLPVSPLSPELATASGLAGGFVYWLIAGRSAGLWKRAFGWSV